MNSLLATGYLVQNVVVPHGGDHAPPRHYHVVARVRVNLFWVGALIVSY